MRPFQIQGLLIYFWTYIFHVNRSKFFNIFMRIYNILSIFESFFNNSKFGLRNLLNLFPLRSSLPALRSHRSVVLYIPGSMLTLTTGEVFKVKAEEWGGVRISVDTFVQESKSMYTLYLPAQSSHIEDPLLASLEFSRMVNDNKEVTLS